MKIIDDLRSLQRSLQKDSDTYEDDLRDGLRAIFMRFWAGYIVVIGLILIVFCFYLGFIDYPEPYDLKIFGWG